MDKEFMLNAKEKYRFASFCLLMRELDKNPKALVHTPIFLDATCSGIQHLAGLMQDHELGTRVNLISQTDESKVEDLYQSLVDPINKALNEYGESHIEYVELSTLKLDRSILKLSIMTKVYNITIFGITRQIEDVLKK